MYYIKTITVSGDNVEASTITLAPGLNIINGPSNCGKSYIAECIDFIFGSPNTRIDKTMGYDTVRIVVVTDHGEVHFKRAFDTSRIDVVSTDFRVPAGQYKLKGEKSVGNIWLKFMGIEEPVQIIRTAAMKRQQLTLRTFSHMLLVKETPVFSENSVLLPTQETAVTAFKTALLYLMTGNNFLAGAAPEDKKTREARRKALESYIFEQLSSITKRKEELVGKAQRKPDELQQMIDAVLSEIDAAEGEISQAVLRSQNLATAILEINDQIAECVNLREKYRVLQGQYDSDLQRITFIAEGELYRGGVPAVTKCPFCNGDLSKEETDSCAEAAKKEIEKLLPQIRDLTDAEQQLDTELIELNERRDAILAERAAIEARVRYELKPRVTSLRTNLIEYTAAVEDSKEATVLLEFEATMKEKLLALGNEPELELKFDVTSHFDIGFRDRFNEIITDLLVTCKFDNFSSGSFDVSGFDVVVNGKPKQTYGKGFRAFLNTILVIAIQEYLAAYGKYKPGILVVDSPILSLKERTSEKATDTMKYSLFQYMLQNQQDRQTIIIENDIPEMDYSAAHMIHFTKDDTGRYGFLAGVR